MVSGSGAPAPVTGPGAGRATGQATGQGAGQVAGRRAGPAPEPGGRGRRLAVPVLLGGGVLVASLALHLRDPHRSGSWGYCPWLLLTGTYCPGCGGLRAVNDLTRGDLAAAASSNLMFVSALPLLGLWWLRALADGWRGRVRAASARRVVAGTVVFAVLAVAFWVARNTTGGAWLAP